MWKTDFFFFFLFSSLLVMGILSIKRLLMYLIFLEIFSILIIFFLMIFKVSYDYTLMMKKLVVMACESAISLSLLVIVVRDFSKDNLSNSAKFEGF